MADQPGYTRMPNDILDAMPALTGAELRMLLAVARKTLGWGKDSDEISLSQFQKLTGLSRPKVNATLQALLARGWVEKIGEGKRGIGRYRLVNLVNQFTELTSKASLPDLVNSVNQTSPGLVNSVNPQKKDLKKDLKKGPARRENAPAGKPQTDHQKLMAAYREALGYPIPNGAKEGAAAQKLLAANYTPEQAIDAYYTLKTRAFYQDKHVSLATVFEQIGALRTKGQGNGTKHTNGSVQPILKHDPGWKGSIADDLNDVF